MKLIKKIKKTVVVTEAICCDRCEKIIDVEDIMEFQECVNIKWTGGFGSIMEDGATWEVDLCQYCVKDLFWPFAKKKKDG